MKTRHGFVSNSSSSSFVITIRDPIRSSVVAAANGNKLVYEELLTPKQLAFLKSQKEFVRTNNPWVPWHQIVECKTGNYFVGHVTCNQTCMMLPLLQNRIPFIADWHYGHETVIYHGHENVVFLRNFGKECGMYSSPNTIRQMLLEFDKEPKYEVRKRKELLKEYEDDRKFLEQFKD